MKKLLHAGEPDNSSLDLRYLMAGEDLENNRLLITITNWAKLVNDGWKTEIGVDLHEVEQVLYALRTYHNHMKNSRT